MSAVITVAGCTSGRAERTRPPASPPATATPRTSTTPPTPTRLPTPTTPPARATPDPFPHGRIAAVRIPGGASRYAARPAYVYLPPAAGRAPHARFPVLELLHGTSGNPSDWLGHGDAEATLDAFAAQHDGRAPIVVMPDINGTRSGDSECVRTPAGGDVEQYLTTEVPAFVRAHYPAFRQRNGWLIAGLSEGGTCALMLALRHPSEYRGFGDFSGLARATLGDRDDEARTVAQLFGGSQRAYDRHDPLWLLAHHTYPTSVGWLVAGAADRAVVDDDIVVQAAARSADLPVQRHTLPGAHQWTVWAAALRRFLPWMWPIAGREG